MRARVPLADTALVAAQLEAAPGWAEVCAAATPELVRAVLDEAARFADGQLAPLNDAMDRHGCRIEDGRVHTAPGHDAAWSAFVASGWPTLDARPEHGGQALPSVLVAAVQEQFDRACPAFGMMPVPQRAAYRLISAWGDAALQAEWLPKLARGDWGATICISEPEAGSDLSRVRTRAAPGSDGNWAITGEKCWISFGDQDLTQRIGHCLLAQTANGLSLFLVPDHVDGVRNAIEVRRIEEKLGLHGSPTCALGFEGARGWLLGEEGRGLAQMFVMITSMRLAVGTMGLGIASGCADLALAYAESRQQGGAAISEHADVQRQLLEMVSRVDVLRGLIFAVANLSDLGDADRLALVQWLLPIVKTLGGDTAVEVASGALEVLGGAGYTREWPVEQALRDARVLPVFEGTTGIQALDLLHRRLLRGDGRGYALFVGRARGAGVPEACVAALENTVAWMRNASAEDANAGATAFLQLAMLAASGWIAADMTRIAGDSPAAKRLRASGRYRLAGIGAEAARLAADATRGAVVLADFGDIRRS